MDEGVDGKTIGIKTETGNHAETGTRNHAVVAEFLAFVDIGDVHLDGGTLQGTDAVLQRHARMGIGTSIEHNAIESEAHLLHLVDQFALDVALIILYFHIGISRPKLGQVVFKGIVAVDARLTHSEEVEVRPVDNLYFHCQFEINSLLLPTKVVQKEVVTKLYPEKLTTMDKENLTTVELTRRYMRYLKLERNFSQNTLDAYHHDIQLLFRYLESQHLTVETVKLEHLEAFAAWVMDNGCVGTRSLARILSGVKSLFRYLKLDGVIENDPSELLESPQCGLHLPEVLTTEEIDRMENSFDMSKAESQRNRAIIETMFSCGLRVSELVNLKWSDIYAEEEFVRVKGKGSKERLVPISKRALEEINKWNLDRNALKIKPGEQDYVFLNCRGAHLTRTMILIMIKRAAAAAGIKKTVSPHTLRHSFATALLKGGADLRAIQEMLGHESIGTTEIYTHLDTTDLRREILEHHPRNLK